jgi:hypothetical protein
MDEQHEQHKEHKKHMKPIPLKTAMIGSGAEDIVTITFHFLPEAGEDWSDTRHSSGVG